MKKILLTGATGFIGSNVKRFLENTGKYIIYAPDRKTLNLKNESAVLEYLENYRFDTVVHFASPTPAKNSLDSFDHLTEDMLRIFMNLYNHSDLYDKMIYTGSGAEYDKSLQIEQISETECFRSVPADDYGLAKMVMNRMACNSKNIYNFRIFACFGPGDAKEKFITHCIDSVKNNTALTIRKNCKFDYIFVEDFARYIEWGIDTELQHHDYNVTSGKEYWLSEIASMVMKCMNSELPIEFLSGDLGNSYTGSNARIVEESGLYPIYSLEEGIYKQIESEK